MLREYLLGSLEKVYSATNFARVLWDTESLSNDFLDFNLLRRELA